MDDRIKHILLSEYRRQRDTIELIASENFASQSVMDLCGSVFTNKYAEGYPGNRYYNGCDNMDGVELLALSELRSLYGVEHANVQPHSGANANSAVYLAFLQPGDKILGMDLASGGHLSHGASVNMSGKIYNPASYGVNSEGWIDYDLVLSQAREFRPKLLICGASAYPRVIDFKAFRSIADDVGATLMVDMAHYSGLIAAGAYPSPAPYADVITSTTHKTLRGPRGGFILWNNPDYTKKINSAVFPGTQGGPLMHIIAAKAQAFIEASSPEFSDYGNAVVKNAKVMCDVFLENDLPILTGGTDSHLVILDLRDSKYTGREAADLLEMNGITVNKNGIPNDPRPFTKTSGVRIGTAAETTRGRSAQWFGETAQRISDILKK